MGTGRQRSGGSTGVRHARRRLAALTAVLALVLTACGDGSDEGADAGDVDELTVWFAREYYVPADLSAFEEETGISVSVDVQPDDDLFQQLIRMADAGQQLPDIVHLDGFLRPVVAEAGVVVPMQDVADQWAEEDPDSYAQIYDAAWEDAMVDGELYGLANSASMEEVFFRSDWFAEAGITEVPQTWDDLLEAARAIKDARPDVTPFGWWAARGNGANHVFSTMTAMGVEFEGSTPQLQTEAGEYFIDYIQTLAREDLLSSDAIAWSDDEMRGGFVGSNVAIMLDSAPTSLDAQEGGLEPDDNFRLVPMPTARAAGADDGELTAPARTFFITSDAEERGAKDAAGLFLRYLMEPDVALEVMQQGGDPARTAAVMEDPAALDAWLPIWDDDNAAAFSDLGPFPIDVNFTSSQDVMERFNEFIVDNPDMDPSAVAEQWQAEFDGVRD